MHLKHGYDLQVASWGCCKVQQLHLLGTYFLSTNELSEVLCPPRQDAEQPMLNYCSRYSNSILVYSSPARSNRSWCKAQMYASSVEQQLAHRTRLAVQTSGGKNVVVCYISVFRKNSGMQSSAVALMGRSEHFKQVKVLPFVDIASNTSTR